jgi:hypothetical protein
MLELLNGFKPHKNAFATQDLCAYNKIQSMKEESNTSQFNQGCNQQRAKTDKKNAAQSLLDRQKIMKYKMGKHSLINMSLFKVACILFDS